MPHRNSSGGGKAQATGEGVGRFPETAWQPPSPSATPTTGIVDSATHKADDAAASIGQGMKSAADTLRSHAPQQQTLRHAADGVADALDRGGQYLKEEGVSGLISDLTMVIRRNPVPAMLTAFGIGLLLARFFNRR